MSSASTKQDEYLRKILEDQEIKPDSTEYKDLQERKSEITNLLKAKFEECTPVIKYAGSFAKKTMNLDDYDLDIACYFQPDDTAAGNNLKEIRQNVSDALSEKYRVEPKTSALRILDQEDRGYTHIDVVPGRFVDTDNKDAYLYLENAEKDRLKTNLKVHIETVRNSGWVDLIRLAKLWKRTYALEIKTFVLELLVIEIMSTYNSTTSISTQLRFLLEKMRDEIDTHSLKDPANPAGNDLSSVFSESLKSNLAAAAEQTLRVADQYGWETIFAAFEKKSQLNNALDHAISVRSQITDYRPWLS